MAKLSLYLAGGPLFLVWMPICLTVLIMMGFSAGVLFYPPNVLETPDPSVTKWIYANNSGLADTESSNIAIGDFNADGVPDVAIWVLGYPSPKSRIYILWGPLPTDTITSQISLMLSNQSAFELILGDGEYANFGMALLSKRSKTGNGDDLVIYAFQATTSGGKNTIFIRYAGRPPVGATSMNLSSGIDGTTGMRITSTIKSFGASLVVGDFNDDGLDDLVASTADFKIFIFWGGYGIQSEIVETDIPFIQFSGAKPNSSQPVSLGKGDINGDGIDDLIISLIPDDTTTWVIYGSKTLAQTQVAPNQLFGTVGTSIAGPATITTGYAYRNVVMDFNGDGHQDIIIGFPTSTAMQPGQINILYGPSTNFVTESGGRIALSEDGVKGTTITGRVMRTLGDWFGWSLYGGSMAGRPLLLGVWAADGTSPTAPGRYGHAVGIWGSQNFAVLGSTPIESLISTCHAFIIQRDLNDMPRFEMLDINNDGVEDILISTRQGLRVVYGKASFSQPTLTFGVKSAVYSPGSPGVVLDPALTLENVACSMLKVKLAKSKPGDVLSITPPASASATFSSTYTNGELTLSGGTQGEYQEALRTLSFSSTATVDDISDDTREIVFMYKDIGDQSYRHFDPSNVGDYTTKVVIFAIEDVSTEQIMLCLPDQSAVEDFKILPKLQFAKASTFEVTSLVISVTPATASDLLEVDTAVDGLTVGAYDITAGTITITGSGSGSAYQDIIRAAMYSNNAIPFANIGEKVFSGLLTFSNGGQVKLDDIVKINVVTAVEIPALKVTSTDWVLGSAEGEIASPDEDGSFVHPIDLSTIFTITTGTVSVVDGVGKPQDLIVFDEATSSLVGTKLATGKSLFKLVLASDVISECDFEKPAMPFSITSPYASETPPQVLEPEEPNESEEGNDSSALFSFSSLATAVLAVAVTLLF